MPQVVGYHRPVSVEEALGLLAQPGTAVLAGGTRLNATDAGAPVVAVDVQALGLQGVEASGRGRLRVGAATTLQQLVDHADVPEGLRDLARREVPSTLRTLATVGGSVAAPSSSSAFVAGLLVHEAVVTIAGTAGTHDRLVADVLADIAGGRVPLAGSLITHVSIATDGPFAAERTGRTPGDEPIVAAVARRGPDGSVRVALSGVASTPILCDDPSSLDPPGDYRGSTEYRRHVAEVLATRVRQAVSA